MAEALRPVRQGTDVAAEYRAREAAGRGETLDEGDLYSDVRPALVALRNLGIRVIVAGNQTTRASEWTRRTGVSMPALTDSGVGRRIAYYRSVVRPKT